MLCIALAVVLSGRAAQFRILGPGQRRLVITGVVVVTSAFCALWRR